MLPVERRGTRILKVVAGIAATGAVVGGVLGGVLGVALVLLGDGVSALAGSGRALAMAALFGAAVGVVLGPTMAFGLMRRVPIGWAVLGTAAGATLGFIAGLFLFPERTLLVTVVGFIVAALALHLRYRERATRP